VPRPVRIHYRRLPDQEEVFHQTLVHETGALVTYVPAATIRRPTLVAGAAVLEPGSPAVWFTFPDAWHDIGRFHRPDGTFTGLYANVLTPVRMDGDAWSTTDLFLDVFITPAGAVHVLDRDELEDAEARGWIDPALAGHARAEAARLVRAVRQGAWPPAVVHAWTLERARRAAQGTPPSPPVYGEDRTGETEGER
jgi:predicted RNA-binding protein associated with RNAse of E/G family